MKFPEVEDFFFFLFWGVRELGGVRGEERGEGRTD